MNKVSNRYVPGALRLGKNAEMKLWGNIDATLPLLFTDLAFRFRLLWWWQSLQLHF